jgi:hypothetical protein
MHRLSKCFLAEVSYVWDMMKVVEEAKLKLNVIEGKMPFEYIVVGYDLI